MQTASPSPRLPVEEALNLGAKYLSVLLRQAGMTIDDLDRLASDPNSRPGFRQLLEEWRKTAPPPLEMIEVPMTVMWTNAVRQILWDVMDLHRLHNIKQAAFDVMVERYQLEGRLRELLIVLTERQRTIICLVYGINRGAPALPMDELALRLRVRPPAAEKQVQTIIRRLRSTWINRLRKELNEFEESLVESMVVNGDVRIDELDLESGLYSQLKSHGLHTLKLLCQKSPGQLLELGISRGAIADIEAALAKRGKVLRESGD